MTSRNLTSRFMELRRSSKLLGSDHLRLDAHENKSSDGLLGGPQSRWEEQRLALPPIWVDRYGDIEQMMADIDSQINRLHAKHKQRFKEVFDAQAQAREREIEDLTDEITSTFRDVEKMLKQIANETEREVLSDRERKVRANMQMAMTGRLKDLSGTFRREQKHYLDNVQKSKEQGGNVSFDFLSYDEQKGEEEEDAFGLDTGFSQAQMSVLENYEDLVQSRDEEIRRIAQNVEEISTIFKELAVLVIDQGTVLDRIDYNMELVIERTEDAIVQLDKANEYQKGARALKCIIFLLVLIGVLLTILIVRHTSNDGNNNKNN